MSDVPGQATYPFVDMRDKVVPGLPDNSGKEHLSIVNCGHDVGGGRSTMEEQKETFQGMMEIDGEKTQCAVAKSRANSTSDNEVDLWMNVCEQGYPSHDCGGARGPDDRLHCHGLHREGGFH